MRSLDTLLFGSEASSVILAFIVVIPHLCRISPRWFTPLAVNLSPGVGRGGRQPQVAARHLCVPGEILANFLRSLDSHFDQEFAAHRGTYADTAGCHRLETKMMGLAAGIA
jgi:hypothetical protein